jgi:predicted alpha/beta superfamily hydrolase
MEPNMKTQTLMKTIVLTIAALFTIAGVVAQEDNGSLKITSITIESKILNENRTILINLPKNYKKDEAYPVLYFLDGEVMTTMAAGQLDYLSRAYMVVPQMIIVGIVNKDRWRDLTPSADTLIAKTSGGGARFMDFLEKEVMTTIEKTYKTAPYRILAGHSLGGLMATYAMVERSAMFNAYIAISPSLQWEKGAMLKDISSMAADKNEGNKYFFFSDASEGAQFHAYQLNMDSIFKSRSMKGLNTKYVYYPDETHISEPVKAFYDGLRFIYPDWFLPYNSSAFKKIMSSDTVIKHYNKLSARYGYKVIPPHDELNSLARFLRTDPKRIDDAIVLLKLNAINFPTSAKLYDLLGETYEKKGEKENARAAYVKAIELDPIDSVLKDKLKKLEL